MGTLSALNPRSQARTQYQPTIASLNQHPLPEWYQDAKLGIFVHWGLYSVPGWAPLSHPNHDFKSQGYIDANPYAEWYYNSMRLVGSPTWNYHREHYGANYNYYNFAEIFDRETQHWNADAFASILQAAGAQYVVLTTKHHDGFTLWPSAVPNPTLPADRQHATRDLVGAMTAAVRRHGMRMGLYYSGGYDWTFKPGPIAQASDYQSVKPESVAYGRYVDAQYRELIERYHPAILWNDIDYPKSGHPLEIEAEYYNAVPDGVVDDRFGIPHADFISPEYSTLSKISARKWEECRGLGQSFGYNRAEGEAQTIAPDKLIALLVDIVSKNGNLLLDVGPEADGTIPPVQMERLRALGAWMRQNGEAIYGTRPWTHAEGSTAQGISLRFTRKGTTLYVTMLGKPSSRKITLMAMSLRAGATISLLGGRTQLPWAQSGNDVRVELPSVLPGRYAWVLRIENGSRGE
jgi:alpha-L-fucosidase